MTAIRIQTAWENNRASICSQGSFEQVTKNTNSNLAEKPKAEAVYSCYINLPPI